MLKFLRRYQAWILAIGGSLLMVAFLLPQAIQQLGQMGVSQTMAVIEVDGKSRKIKGTEWRDAQAELDIIDRMSGGAARQNMVESLLNPRGLSSDHPDYVSLAGVDHWILLKLEAERAGLIGGWVEGRNFLDEVALQQMFAYEGDVERARSDLNRQLMQAAGGAQRTLEDGYRALANYIGVRRLVEMYQGAGVASDLRLRHVATDYNHTAVIETVFIDARKFVDEIPDPSEEELLAHFETYKDEEPGSGEFGIGYRQPDRFQLEYVVVDYNSIRDTVDDSRLNVRRWFLENKYEFATEEGEDPTFEAFEPQARERYVTIETQKKVDEILRAIKTSLLEKTQLLERDGDLYVLPEDWADRRASFETIRQTVADEWGVDVSYYRQADEMYLFDNIIQFERIGRGAVRLSGTQRTTLGDLIRSHAEFGKGNVPGLQVGVADPEPVRTTGVDNIGGRRITAGRDIIFYRVIAADPERPARFEEVAEQATEDWKRLKVYHDRLVPERDTWEQRAIAEGIETLAESLEATTNLRTISRYDRTALRTGEGGLPPSIPDIGRNAELCNRIFDMLEQIDPLADLEEVDPAQKTVVVTVPAQLSLVAAVVQMSTPLVQESFVQMVNNGILLDRQYIPLAAVNTMLELGGDLTTPFAFETLRDAYKYEDRGRDRREPAPDGMSAPEDEAGGDGDTGDSDEA